MGHPAPRTPRLRSMTHMETGLQTGGPIKGREAGARCRGPRHVLDAPLPWMPPSRKPPSPPSPSPARLPKTQTATPSTLTETRMSHRDPRCLGPPPPPPLRRSPVPAEPRFGATASTSRVGFSPSLSESRRGGGRLAPLDPPGGLAPLAPPRRAAILAAGGGGGPRGEGAAGRGSKNVAASPGFPREIELGFKLLGF